MFSLLEALLFLATGAKSGFLRLLVRYHLYLAMLYD